VVVAVVVGTGAGAGLGVVRGMGYMSRPMLRRENPSSLARGFWAPGRLLFGFPVVVGHG
jgi:hypothetical protein